MVFSFQFLPQQQLLTPLDVVNYCLATIGREPVDSLVGNQDANVALILNELNSSNMEVQLNSGDGWAWNADEGVTLALNPDGTISLPLNTLMVRTAYNTRGAINPTQVCERPVGLLYDMTNHTNVFTSPQVVDLVVLQDFTMIPNAGRNYIGRMAAFKFQAKQQSSSVVVQVTKADLDNAQNDCLQHDDASRPQNSINANTGVLYRLYGQGVRRNRAGS